MTEFEALFNDWKAEFNFSAFISDGILNPKKYAPPHILFILRDMNCRTERNLCDDLRRDGSGAKTWCNVGRWVTALLDGNESYPYDMSGAKRAEQLSRISVINLKKEGGGSRTDGGELADTVARHKKYIAKEIELCAPDIIICCGLNIRNSPGNAALLHENIFGGSPKWQSFPSAALPRDWWHYDAEINEKTVPVISFCHPQVTNLCGRRGHEKLFKPLYRDMLYIREKFITKELN